MISFEDAVETFVHGFGFVRSRTHPYLAERLAPGIWRLADAPRRSGDYRRDEFTVWDTSPEQAVEVAAAANSGRWVICHLLRAGESDRELRAAYKALGFRLTGTEEFFAHSLEAIPSVPEPFPIERVTRAEQLAALARATGARPRPLEQHIGDTPALRQYMALDDAVPVGWVSSIVTRPGCWCSSMWVQPDYRRRGVARALMARMLRDDAAAGAPANVLLASHAGSKLYPVVGYESLGMLYLYVPRRDR
jgi:GNAT superfamily N-acetyltransferase